MNGKSPLQWLLNSVKFVNKIKKKIDKLNLKGYGKVDLWIYNFTKVTINLYTKADLNSPFSMYKTDFRDTPLPRLHIKRRQRWNARGV